MIIKTHTSVWTIINAPALVMFNMWHPHIADKISDEMLSMSWLWEAANKSCH